MPRLHLCSFKVDTQIPVGHPLCGGWIAPASAITEPLYAQGVVLLGEEAPIVLCAVDWTGICNEGHTAWRRKLAQAAHTTPERVAVHCVHQHNAPFADPQAQRLIQRHADLPASLDLAWFDRVLDRVAEAVRLALGRTEVVTHVAWGQARVHKVASNRRVLGPDGKLRWWRGSSCRDPVARQQPEGVVDPWLKAISFWRDDRLLLRMYYYACHPMSYYGDGLVTSDFVGLAREARTKEEGAPHLYWTGCAGDVAAGKYNDGDRANRFLLAQRLYSAMAEAAAAEQREAYSFASWKSVAVTLPPRQEPAIEQLQRTLSDPRASVADRNRSAMELAFRARLGQPIELGCLCLGPRIRVLHLPGEPFVEFQLYAQRTSPQAFVAVTGYGDGGPWYIPTAPAYAQGGYEPSVAFVSAQAEEKLRDAIATLLTDAG